MLSDLLKIATKTKENSMVEFIEQAIYYFGVMITILTVIFLVLSCMHSLEKMRDGDDYEDRSQIIPRPLKILIIISLGCIGYNVMYTESQERTSLKSVAEQTEEVNHGS